MRKKLVYILVLLMIGALSAMPWAHTYRTICDQKKMARRQIFSTEIVVMEKKDIQPFSQLLVSWNAHRPSAGYFSFFVQVRDCVTKKWGVWHHMYDWGCGGIQASYRQPSDGVSRYEYVRLELESGHTADGLRIKVKLQKNVRVSDLISVTAACALFDQFQPEDPRTCNVLPSVCVHGVSKIAQFALDHEDKERVCSPVSMTMVLRYLNNTPAYPDVFTIMEHSYDKGLKAYGSWPFNIACAFDALKGAIGFYVCRLRSFADIHHELLRNAPVVVSVRGPIPGAERPYAGGHLLVVIGWDKENKRVICHDPAFDDAAKVIQHYPVDAFLAAWERSRRLAYCVVQSQIHTPRSVH